MNRLSTVAVLIALGWPGAGWAADACIGTLTSAQILGCLAPAPAAVPKTRGFPGQTRGIRVQGEQPPAEEVSVNLMVNFDFNSAQLTNDGMIALDALGQALTNPALRDARFRIAGHTDAVGSDAANQKLSEARAGAVRSYLAAHFSLNAGNFEVVGFGKTQLYAPGDPNSAINRRVQITKLGS